MGKYFEIDVFCGDAGRILVRESGTELKNYKV